jgi:hypothetical protein
MSALPRFSLSFNDSKTTCVEVKQMGYLVFCFGRTGGYEPWCGGCCAAYSRGSGDKLEQIKSNIFIPARTVRRSSWLVHETTPPTRCYQNSDDM